MKKLLLLFIALILSCMFLSGMPTVFAEENSTIYYIQTETSLNKVVILDDANYQCTYTFSDGNTWDFTGVYIADGNKIIFNYSGMTMFTATITDSGAWLFDEGTIVEPPAEPTEPTEPTEPAEPTEPNKFELPAWLSISSVTTGVINFTALLAALIKLRNNSKSTVAEFSKIAKALNINSNILQKANDTLDKVGTMVTSVSTALDKAIDAITEQNKSTNNIAAFIFECFNVANLSDENKLKLKVLYDQLFYKTDAAIIDELKTAKLEADKVLIEKDKLITNLQHQVEASKESLSKAQSTIRKSRRISG